VEGYYEQVDTFLKILILIYYRSRSFWMRKYSWD